MNSEIDGPFQYLVDRILRRRAVPLVGAGISAKSTKGGQPWDGHTIWRLIERALTPTIAARLKRFATNPSKLRVCTLCDECFSSQQAYRNAFREFGVSTLSNCLLCDLRLAKEQNALTKACEAFLWEHGGPNNPETYKKLVDRLQIGEFVDLAPTPAHFYLAFLAREGLVTEVVTTNYDCNLERAYAQTWHKPAVHSDDIVRVVFDLNTFAESAALSADSRPGEDTAHVLRVYKINGCAAELKDNPNHARDILLTASQLQDWRKRKWAADFFRTKVRAASLVTIGFGSDEPQVVHTLQQVLEEFSGLTKNSPQSIFEAANAPIVTTYEHYPSFQQLQLVHGFADWWTGEPTMGDALVIGPYERAALTSAPDVPLSAPACLPADLLWADVFQMVFSRLLYGKLREAALSENAAFTATVPHADKLLMALAADLESHATLQLTNPSAAAHWLARLEDCSGSVVAARPMLSRCISHIRVGSGCPDHYCALNDHGSLAAELAFLFGLLRGIGKPLVEDSTAINQKSDWWMRVTLLPEGPIEVYLPPTLDSPLDFPALYISGRLQVEDGRLMSIPERAGPNQRVELVIGTSGRRGSRLQDRRAYVVEGDSRIPIVVVRVDWRSLFPESMPEASISEVAERLENVVRFPSKFRRRLDSSLRTNPLLQRRVSS